MEKQNHDAPEPEMRAPAFSLPQTLTIFVISVVALLAPHYFPVKVLEMKGYLLTNSTITFGFIMTSMSLFIKRVEEIAKHDRRGFLHAVLFRKDINLYGALVFNATIAMFTAIWNIALGVVLIILDPCKIKEDSIYLKLLESLVLVSIAIAILYTFLLTLRIFAFLTDINGNK